MEYLYPIGWVILALALAVYGASLFRRKPAVYPEAKVMDLAPTVELLLDVANYLAADASKAGHLYQLKLEIEAKRLTGGK